MSEPIKIVVDLTPAKFVIDDPECGVFEGLHLPGEHWNGFDCPVFTREVVEQIFEAASTWSGDESLSFAWEGDVILTYDPCYEGEEPERLLPNEYRGELVWGLGSNSWVWQAWTDEELAEHAELRAAELNGRHP